MRKYEDEQQKGVVLFEGTQASTLKQLRTDMDLKADKICKDIHAAINAAEARFDELNAEYGPKFEAVLKTTELSNLGFSEVGFDYSKMEKHGVIFAKKVTNPIEAFIELLRSGVQDGPNPSSDSIFIEPKGEDYISKSWGKTSSKEPVSA